MTKAKATKKNTKVKKERGDTFAIPASPSNRKTVEIKKAKNGFIISQWGDKGEVSHIAKTQAEANCIAAKMLKI